MSTLIASDNLKMIKDFFYKEILPFHNSILKDVTFTHSITSVSYTHLDVYKRQVYDDIIKPISIISLSAIYNLSDIIIIFIVLFTLLILAFTSYIGVNDVSFE